MSLTSKKVSVVLAGFGCWARERTLAPYLSQAHDIRVRAACRLLPDSEGYLKSDGRIHGHSDIVFTNDLHHALSIVSEYAEPHALVINTPNALHFADAMEGVCRGLHVYIERPLATPCDDLPSLLSKAKAAGVTIYTGVQRRLEAPFEYLHDVVRYGCDFGSLSSIRCTFSVGRRLTGWRTDLGLAGGGIVIDSGYHLIDIAAWIAEAAGVKIPDSLSGFVHFKDFTGDDPYNGVEQTAIGCLKLKENVHLSFDFTYLAPHNSVYERVDIRDSAGAQVSLTRDLVHRNPTPGKVRHQNAAGDVVIGIQLPGSAMNTGPMAAFFAEISGEAPGKGHRCRAESSLATWRLIKGIYELGRYG